LKLNRIRKEKEKTKSKIAELQERLLELDKQEIEAENAEILTAVRKAKLSVKELQDFIAKFRTQGTKAEDMLTDSGTQSANDIAKNIVTKNDKSFLETFNIPSITDENGLLYNGETETQEDSNNYEN